MKQLIAPDFKFALDQENNPQILDVRTPSEYAEGFIPSAQNCDIFEVDFLAKAQALLDKSKAVYVYCRSGGRSSSAAAILEHQGFEVVNLIGGYTAWAVKGY